ncbi:MAG TPA: D-alanyl-D-alanine carboxypeptidase/D-alanyl-D-alanine-endopeptidase [Polyangia bacterium]|nr:D-alanyl-D-alanine carboxypeptidase/D-alanyl-D-alanine-endopeptidase [Polyangia bacterium]
MSRSALPILLVSLSASVAYAQVLDGGTRDAGAATAKAPVATAKAQAATAKAPAATAKAPAAKPVAAVAAPTTKPAATAPPAPVVAAAPKPAELPDGGDAKAGKFAPTLVTPAPTASTAERGKWLKDQIDAALNDPGLGASKVGIAVEEVDSGKLLYERNDGGLFNPASNVKLFTTAAALAILGPEYRWKTVVYAETPVSGGELKGKLYIKGHGDPSLVVEDLWKIVGDLYAGGLRKVSGDLAVDDSFFDAVRVGPGFEQKNEDAPFRAPNGALSLNYNAVGVHVYPGAEEAAPARVILDPQTPYFTIVDEARTVASGRTLITVESHEAADHTEIVVRGRIRAGDPGQVVARRVAHPDLFAAYAFRELLSRRGIKISGNVVRDTAPTTAKALNAHYSQPLGVVVRDVNKHSNNFMAEQILKTLGAETGGRPGTWQKGLDAVAGFLAERLGINHDKYKMTNGSGLYASNLFSPLQLVTLLRFAYKDFRFAADFIGSLALAGADGTVSHRMEGSLAERYVRAKTGTLAGVSCLAGYAGAPGHPPLAFAIFMNDVPDPATQKARKAQDAIAEALVAYLLSH